MTTFGAIELSTLGLGGNVLGWTADRETSFAVLDAFADAGGTVIDTAESYAGTRSEEILGEWMEARGNRDDLVISTKVGPKQVTRGNLEPVAVAAAVEGSLRRLRTDRIDLYFAHFDDHATAQEDTLRAFDALVRSGKVVALGASNLGPRRIRSSLAISARDGLAPYRAVEPHYNLMERPGFESGFAPLIREHDLLCFPYFGLAKGFLTGKYRPGTTPDGPRTEGAEAYLSDWRAPGVLAALDEIAAGHGVTPAAVALAWLAAQPMVTAPLASARTVDQLRDLLPVLDLKLADDELRALDDVTETS